MGTMIALFLVLSTLAGCAGDTLTNVKNALPEQLPEASITYQVSCASYEEDFPAESGRTLMSCAYTVPVLTAVRADGTEITQARSFSEEQALERTSAFNAQFADWRADAPHLQALLEEAREIPNGQPLVEELVCTAYQASHFISVSGSYYNYAGGAHPNTMLLSWNFDLDNGVFFDPELLGENDTLRKAVSAELERQAESVALENGMAPEEFFWADYAEILADWSSYAVFFDEEGMTVGFSPYELACYAAGPQVFRLSYDVLRPHLGREACVFLGLDKQ